MSDASQQFDPTAPIVTDLPARLAQYQRKYSGKAQDPNNVLYPALRAATPGARSALQRLDLQRIGRGQDPYTATQSAYGLTAASRQQAVTPEPETGLWGDIIRNTGDLVRGLNPFVLAPALYREAQALPESLAMLPDALANSDGGGPLNTLGNVANLPGFRFVPGAFVAGAYGDEYTDPTTGNVITPGGTGQLVDNPLFTALDVLPFASKAAKMSGTYKSVAEASAEQARILGNPAPRAPRPIPTVLRNIGGTVDQTSDLRAALIAQGVPERGLGNLAVEPGIKPGGGKAMVPPPATPGPVIIPNRFGAALNTGSQRFAGTGVGRYIADARSPRARTTAERSIFAASYLTDPDKAATLDPVAKQIAFDTERELSTLRAAIPEERLPAIYDALVRDDQTVRASFTPEEQAYVDRFTQGQQVLEQHLVDLGERAYNSPRRAGKPSSDRARAKVYGLLKVPFAHGDEIFDYATGSKILDARRAVDVKSWFGDKLTEYRSATPSTAAHITGDSLQSELTTILSDTHLKATERYQAVRLSLLTARRAGLDVDHLIAAWGAKPNVLTREAFARTVADPTFPASLRALPATRSAAEIVADTRAAIAPLRTDRMVVLLDDALARGDISAARATVRQLKARSVYIPPIDFPALKLAFDDLAAERRAVTEIESKLGATPKSVSKAIKDRDKLERKSMPARWDDLVRDSARNKLVAEIQKLQASGKLTPEEASVAIDAASQNLVARVESVLGQKGDPAIARLVNTVASEAKQSWQDLAARGLDPQWVHRVTPTSAARMANPVIFDIPTLRPGQMKARLWDPAPVVKDLTISLTHQAYDILNAKASAQFAEEMRAWYGVTGQEVTLKLESRARRAMAKDPSKTLQQHLNEIARREYTEYDPAALMRGKQGKDANTLRVSNSADQILIPREVASTLDRLRPTLPSTFEKATSRPMQVFRTSLLPLSPRWHLYNIVGGAIMLGSTSSPRVVMHMAEALRMARNEGDELGRIASDTGRAAMPPGGAQRAATEWFQQAGKSPLGRASVGHSFAAGHTLGRIFKPLIEKSYDFNQFVDNFYRSLSYLDGESTGLARGMSRSEAIDAGITAARDTLQSWDRLTPVERSGMRVIFPFYSWSRHLLSFVMQYPHDHPWRLAITARIAETELADNATGLPSKFASMFTPFGVDADGNTTAIVTDGINPFKDVTNWALLAGFISGQKEGSLATVTSRLNPLVGTALEVAGFDTFRGTPDLYPDLTYDPATGQLTSLTNGNFPIALVNNLIPQTELLTNLAGMNEEYKDLARRDPDAARRQMFSNLGLPSSLVRDINVNEETIKAEMQRLQQMRDTRTEALSTGNLGLLDQYPVLDAYKTQIRAAGQQGQLGQFQPTTSDAYTTAAEQAQVDTLQRSGRGTGMDLFSLLTGG